MFKDNNVLSTLMASHALAEDDKTRQVLKNKLVQFSSFISIDTETT
jgi:hypothetical protein